MTPEMLTRYQALAAHARHCLRCRFRIMDPSWMADGGRAVCPRGRKLARGYVRARERAKGPTKGREGTGG